MSSPAKTLGESGKSAGNGAGNGAADTLIDCKINELYYGDFKAVRDVDIAIKKGTITAFIGPSGLRQEHGAALPQPHERPGARLPLQGPRALPRPGHLPPASRSGRRAPPHRHGLPAAQSRSP